VPWRSAPAHGAAKRHVPLRLERLEERRVLTPVIDVGHHVLLPDTPGQTFQVSVTGGDLVQGLNFNLQVADGGPEWGGVIDGPAIEALDILTGTIFDGNNTGTVDLDGGPPSGSDIAPQYEGRSTTTDSGSVPASGLLATVTIDTTGFSSGTWDLFLSNTLNGPTDFAGLPASITDGSIRVLAFTDLGTVTDSRVEGLNPSTGVLWYRVQSSRAGYLTLIASFAGAADTVGLALYDANFNLLADSTPGVEMRRLDYDGPAAAQNYWIKLSGANADVDLRLVNLVGQAGTAVTVSGTTAADTFALEQAADYAVTINGVDYHFGPAGVATIAFNGVSGGDSAVLGGSTVVDTVQMNPKSASLNTGTLLASVTNCPTITVRGNGGTDTVTMNDSTLADTLTASPQTAVLAGPGFTNTVEQMPNIYVYARNGGRDLAYLNGGASKDKIKFDTNVAWIRAGSYYIRPKFFDEMYVDGMGGTTDTAIFYDTPGVDVLAASPTETTVTTGGVIYRVTSFENVTVYGTAIDTATFSDSSGDDIFNGLNHKSYMYGSGYKVVSRGFKKVTATASTGFDKARLYDTALDDHYECRPGISKVTGGGTSVLSITAQGFDRVSLVPTQGGFDTADLYDTPDNDRLDAAGDGVQFYRVGTTKPLYDVLAVERVIAHGSTGTNARNVTEPLAIDLIFEGSWTP